MVHRNHFTICLLFITFCSVAIAQPYRCEWQVVAIGGGDIGGAYRVGSTVGQTAVGWMSTTNLLAHIGFWYPDIVTGIEEKGRFRWESADIKETRLYPPAPNPFYRTTRIRYTLTSEQHATVQICDITGRIVRTLVNSNQKPGRYSLTWDARDNSNRTVASGVYICRFVAGDYQRNTKLILQH